MTPWPAAHQALLSMRFYGQEYWNLPVNAGNVEDAGSIPASGRSPGGGHGDPLQYSCLENPTDRGTWRAAVHRVAESDLIEVT